MRRLEYYVKKYGPEFGQKLSYALQSQAAHAEVSARLRRRIDVLTGKPKTESKLASTRLPLFPEANPEPENTELLRVRKVMPAERLVFSGKQAPGRALLS